MAFGDILEKVKEIFTGGDETETVQSVEPSEQDTGGILPASQDPYGDPADMPQGNMTNTAVYNNSEILPASQDPYGDPADDMTGGMSNGGEYGGDNILPASQDPLGDPADEAP